MELAAIGAFVAGMTGGAVGSFAGGWVERGRYRRQWEDQLIPAAREFAAATRELVRAEQAHGRDSIPKDVADAWTERHQALVPVEHHLPMMLQTIMNSPVVSAKDDGTRWALLNKIADYLDEEWQLLAARQQRSAWDRLRRR